MNSFTLIRKNLGRKKARTLFTGLSIVVAFLLFGLLTALAQAFTLGVELAGADRLITIHKVSLIQLMPESYARRTEALEGIDRTVHQTWFSGYYQEPRNQIPTFPVVPEDQMEVYPEYQITPEEREAWLNNQTGMMVGRALADRFGWKLGDQIPIGSTLWPQQDGNRVWPLTVEAIFDGVGDGADEQQIFMHYEYFDEARQFGQGLVGWFVHKIAEPENAEAVANEIDAMFANSPAETKTTTEKGWVQGFAKQFGNIGLMVTAVLAAVFFSLLLVAGNTMAQAVRERTKELAVLKTIGFSDGRVMRQVLGESLLLASVGGLIGLLLAWLTSNGLKASLGGVLPGLTMGTSGFVWGLILIVVLGVVAGLWPAVRAQRLKVVDALATR